MALAILRDPMLNHLLRTYGRSPWVWLGILLTTLSQIAYKLVVPWVMTWWIVGLARTRPNSIYDLIYVAAAYLFGVLFGYFGDFVFIRQSDARYEYLVGGFYDRIFSKPVSFFRDAQAAKLGGLFREHMDGTINLFRFVRADVIPLLVATIGPVVVLLFHNWIVAVIFALGVTLRGYVTWRMAATIKPLRNAAQEVYHRLTGAMGDQMANLSVVRASANAAQNRSVITRLAAEEGQLYWVRHRAAAGYDVLGMALTATCFAAAFFAIATTMSDAENRLVMAVLSTLFVIQGLQAINVVVELNQRWSQRWKEAASSLEQLNGNTMPRPVQASGLHQRPTGDIEFKEVTFAYDGVGRNPVFESLNLSVPNGQHTAIVGKNGAGKSTLANILLRFDEIQEGRVTLGGRDLYSYSDDALYRSIGYVPQSPRLFNATLRENILFFEPEASADRLEVVCDLVGLSGLIQTKRLSFDMRVGEGGTKISGGESQRVAIARALLRDAPIYIFDEPTSSINADDARAILENLRAHLHDRTLIVITHSRTAVDAFSDLIEVANRGAHWRRRAA